MEVIVDTREPREILTKLKEHGIPCKQEKLDIGDILIGNILIERKHIRDLVNSVRSKRIWKQLYQMKSNEEFKHILLVIGDISEAFHPNVKNWFRYKAYLQKMLLSLKIVSFLSFNVMLVQVKDMNEMIEFIKLLYQRGTKVSLRPVKKKSTNIKDVVSDMLSCIPRIGRKIAEEIVKKYSIKDLSNLSIEELSSIKVKNKKLGKKGKIIYEVLRWKGGKK